MKLLVYLLLVYVLKINMFFLNKIIKNLKSENKIENKTKQYKRIK